MNTGNDEALTVEHRSAHQAFALQEAEHARNMVIPTPQYVELPLYANTGGEGNHYHWGPTHTHDGVSAPPARLLGTNKY
jgi:hypothetical protein